MSDMLRQCITHTHRSSAMRNHLIPRLQYLTEIPPSLPVNLLPLQLVDEAGSPIVHPLQIAPDSLNPKDVEEDGSPPASSSSASGFFDKDDMEPRSQSLLPVHLSRPPLAFIRRHSSASSRPSTPGSNASSSSSPPRSPLTGTPSTPLLGSLDVLPTAAKGIVSGSVSPLASMYGHSRRNGRCQTASRCLSLSSTLSGVSCSACILLLIFL